MRIIQDLIENPAPAVVPATVPTMSRHADIVGRYRALLAVQGDAQARYDHLAKILEGITTGAVCNQVGLRFAQLSNPADVFELLGALGLAYAVDQNKPAMLAALKAYMVAPHDMDVTRFQTAYADTLHAAGFAF